MGADLYIKKLPRAPQHTGFRTDIEAGYFRDAYNATNILWKYGLSYWALSNELPFDEEGDLTIDGVQLLLDMIEKREAQFQKFIATVNEQWLKDNNCRIDDDEDSVKGWVDFWIEKSINLKIFLRKAIDLGSVLIWSV